MRVFVALDLPDEVLAPITRLQAGLEVGRIVPEENLHLTLAFLGDMAEAQLPDLAEALALMDAPAVDLSLRGLDLLGGRSPKVLCIPAEASPVLTRLHDKVARAARTAGVALPRDRFRPHVTISRLPRQMNSGDERRLGEFLALNGAFRAPVARATQISLVQSHLRPDGPLYLPLAEFPLVG